MKKLNLFLVLALAVMSLNAQSKNEALSADKLVWLGLDFTKTRFIGKATFTSKDDLVNNFIPAWNKLMISEAEKFDISDFFKVETVEEKINYAYKLNSEIGSESIIMDMEGRDYKITEEDVKNVVKNYNVEGDGYALLFIVESFNKIDVKATIWVTYFHIPTKQVVFTKSITNKPVGFGTRNYWAGAIYATMKKSKLQKDDWLKE